MKSDSALDVLVCPSPNHGERDEKLDIDILLLHYTGMPDGDGALKWLCSKESGVSAHYFIHKDGRIVQMVPEARRAWHAGESVWAGEYDINGCSIGIEIANEGPGSAHPEFPQQQMNAVIALCRDIVKRRAIPPERVLAHSDVAPGRKSDPGDFFNWSMLAEAGIGLMAEPVPIVADYSLSMGDTGDEVRVLQASLAAFGYGMRVSGEFCGESFNVVQAFQRHFRQQRIDGVADASTRKTLSALLQSLDVEIS